MAFSHLKPAAYHALNELDLEEVIHIARLIGNWSEIIGKPLDKKTRPLRITKGTLTILTQEPAYAQHLKYYESTIIELLATDAVLGEGIVKKIKFKVGEFQPLPETPQPQPPAPKKRGREKDQALNEAEAKTSHIKDGRLKKAFSRAMAQAARNREKRDK